MLKRHCDIDVSCTNHIHAFISSHSSLNKCTINVNAQCLFTKCFLVIRFLQFWMCWRERNAKRPSYDEQHMPVSLIFGVKNPAHWHNLSAPYLISENAFQAIIKCSRPTDTDIHRAVWFDHLGSNTTCQIVSEGTQKGYCVWMCLFFPPKS